MFDFLKWKVWSGTVTGTDIIGDKDAPRTRLWRLPLLIAFFWKVRVVFRIAPEDAEAGYRVGYVPQSGTARIFDVVLHDKMIQFRVGHEDVTFFAVNLDGAEIPLPLYAVSTVKSNPGLKRIPLY